LNDTANKDNGRQSEIVPSSEVEKRWDSGCIIDPNVLVIRDYKLVQ